MGTTAPQASKSAWMPGPAKLILDIHRANKTTIQGGKVIMKALLPFIPSYQSTHNNKITDIQFSIVFRGHQDRTKEKTNCINCQINK